MKLATVVTLAAAALAVILPLPVAESAGSFPRVRLFSPKEGQIWFTGETRTIVWRIAYLPPPPIPATLNITLRRVGDDSFRMPLTALYPLGASQFKWKIPAGLENHDDYYVRVLPNRLVAGKPNMMASKSKPFTIVTNTNTPKSLTVLQPADGAIWYGGQSRFIQWKFDGASPDATISIFIEDTTTGVVGKPFPYVIADKLPAVPTVANVAGYRWQVPYSFRTSKGYQIRIVAEYPESATKEPINAVMKGTFTIVQTGDANSGGTAIPGPTLVPGEPKTTVSILPVPEQTVTILPVPEQTVSTLPVPTAV